MNETTNNSSFLTSMVERFAHSSFYVNFCKNLPEGLNNPYLDFILLIIILVVIGISIKEFIMSLIWRAKNKKHKEELLALKKKEEAEKKKKEAEEKERAEFERLTQDPATAQTEVSFEQWKKDGNKTLNNDLNDTNTVRDVATGLYNVNGYNQILEALSEDDLCIIRMNINGLKSINEHIGDKYGDKVIRVVSKEIKNAWQDKGCRIGGDDFVVLLNAVNEKMTENAINKFRQTMAAKTANDMDGVTYSVAIGFAMSGNGKTKDEIFAEAEEKMQLDKKLTKANRVEHTRYTKSGDVKPVKLIAPTSELIDESKEEREIYEIDKVEKIADTYKPKEEVKEDIIDPKQAQKILEEKQREAREAELAAEDDEPENGLMGVLASLDAKKRQEQELAEANAAEAEIVQHNMQALDHKVESNLAVEGGTSKKDNRLARREAKEDQRRIDNYNKNNRK